MSMTEIVKVFGERKIRSVWDDVAEENIWEAIVPKNRTRTGSVDFDPI